MIPLLCFLLLLYVVVIVIVITGCRDEEVDPHHRALTDTVTRLDKEGCSKPNVFSWIGS